MKAINNRQKMIVRPREGVQKGLMMAKRVQKVLLRGIRPLKGKGSEFRRQSRTKTR